jgi:hypothetical protein
VFLDPQPRGFGVRARSPSGRPSLPRRDPLLDDPRIEIEAHEQRPPSDRARLAVALQELRARPYLAGERGSAHHTDLGLRIQVGAPSDLLLAKETSGRAKDLDALPRIRAELIAAGTLAPTDVRGPVAEFAHEVGPDPRMEERSARAHPSAARAASGTTQPNSSSTTATVGSCPITGRSSTTRRRTIVTKPPTAKRWIANSHDSIALSPSARTARHRTLKAALPTNLSAKRGRRDRRLPGKRQQRHALPVGGETATPRLPRYGGISKPESTGDR